MDPGAVADPGSRVAQQSSWDQDPGLQTLPPEASHTPAGSPGSDAGDVAVPGDACTPCPRGPPGPALDI